MNIKTILRLVFVYLKIPVNLLFSLVLCILNYFFPDFVNKKLKEMSNKNGQNINSAEDANFLFSTELAKTQFKVGKLNALKSAQLGYPAPHIKLINLETSGLVSLLSLASAGRPLVLNFGSCT